MKTINKTQATALKKINRTLSNIETALLSFEDDCLQKRHSSLATVDDRMELEEYVHQTNLAVVNIRGVKSHIKAICDLAGI